MRLCYAEFAAMVPVAGSAYTYAYATVPYQQLMVADPLAVGIDATGLTWLSPVIKVAALFGLFSTMLVNLLAQTRIFYSMSRDGLLPGLFSTIHPRFRTPHISTIMTGAIIAFAAGLTPIGVLSQLGSIGTLLAFVLVCIGVIVLRCTAPDALRPFRTPEVPCPLPAPSSAWRKRWGYRWRPGNA